MVSHQARFFTILALFALAVAGLVACEVLGLSPTLQAYATGALAVLTPAVFDALKIEQRRKDPAVKTIVDDVDG